MDSYRSIFKENSVLAKNFSSLLIEKMIPLIEEVKFTPEQIIYEKGELGESGIYFIQEGKVEVLSTSSNVSQAIVLKTLVKKIKNN
jgi:CRP-like cAMP-binding protein